MPDPDGHPDLDEIELGSVFAALADPLRRQVIEDLCKEEDGVERTCASFNLKISKSTMTHHFRVLREAGLIRQIDYGNSRKVTLRRDDLRDRFPGLLDLLETQDS
jgi:DNA-binding transcriptional ArsR family regulator